MGVDVGNVSVRGSSIGFVPWSIVLHFVDQPGMFKEENTSAGIVREFIDDEKLEWNRYRNSGTTVYIYDDMRLGQKKFQDLT